MFCETEKLPAQKAGSRSKGSTHNDDMVL